MNKYDHRSDNRGALFVALLFVLVLGGALLAGGWFTWRVARVAGMQEAIARDRMVQARQLATDQEPAPAAIEISIQLGADGSLTIDGQTIDPEQLEPLLADKAQGETQLTILISAEDEVSIGQVRQLIQRCEKFGQIKSEIFKLDQQSIEDQ